MKANQRTPHNIEKARQMYDTGQYSRRQVGDMFGVAESTIRQWLATPEEYQAWKNRNVEWGRRNKDLINARASIRCRSLSREQKDILNARQRVRFARDPRYKETLRKLRHKYMRTAQGYISQKVRLVALGYSGRIHLHHEAFMLAVTGLTHREFTDRFNAEGVFDHIVPVCAFDLTNPQHLARCCYPANLRIIPEKENQFKGSTGRNVDIMSLPWIETEDALVQSETFIARCLKKLDRLKEAGLRMGRELS